MNGQDTRWKMLFLAAGCSLCHAAKKALWALHYIILIQFVPRLTFSDHSARSGRFGRVCSNLAKRGKFSTAQTYLDAGSEKKVLKNPQKSYGQHVFVAPSRVECSNHF